MEALNSLRIDIEDLHGKGQFKDALEILNEKSNALNKESDYWDLMGFTHWYLEDSHMAEKSFEKALWLNPNDSRIMIHYLCCASEIKEFKDVRMHIEVAVEQHGNSGILEKTIAECEHETWLKPWKKDLTRLKEVCDLNLATANAIREGLLQNAITLAAKALDLDNESAITWNLKGLISYLSQDYENAYGELLCAVKIHPVYEDALLNLTDAAYYAKRFLDIKSILLSALEANPELENVKKVLQIMEEHGEEIYAEDPNLQAKAKIDALNLDADKALADKDYEKAITLYNELLELDPSCTKIYQGLAVVSMDYNNNMQDAMELLSYALKLEPLNKEVLKDLYTVAITQGCAEAVEDYAQEIYGRPILTLKEEVAL